MRVLVYPHLMSIGGSQLNAIECAAAIRDRGHQVTVFGETGPLVEHVRALALPFVEAPPAPRRPAPAVMGALRRIVRAERIDVVHAYEWPPALEAFYAMGLHPVAAPLCTVMSMAVAPFLPDSMPLLVGTRQLQEHARAERSGLVGLLEPPIDTDANRPDGSGSRFKEDWGIPEEAATIVCVSRLAHELKLEGLLRSIRAAGSLAAGRDVRLVIVGDGPAREQVAAQATATNRESGQRTVVLTGALTDPRPAYDAADVILGMGGSILRGMAFGKPAICLGERGFARIVSAESIDEFLWQGFYGVGENRTGDEPLRELLAGLLAAPGRRAELGRYARSLVVDRFSLAAAGTRLEAFYEQVRASRSDRRSVATDAAVTARGLLGYKVTQRYLRWRGRGALDDFNASPVAARGGTAERQPIGTQEQP